MSLNLKVFNGISLASMAAKGCELAKCLNDYPKTIAYKAEAEYFLNNLMQLKNTKSLQIPDKHIQIIDELYEIIREL